MLRVRNVNEQRVTFEVVLGHLRKRDFAVLSTVDKEGNASRGRSELRRVEAGP